MLKKLWNKKNDKKGFTLVELIVVLIILAILAALLVPALTGYIDKAKEKRIIAETRQAVMAAQTLADEEYAIGTADNAIIIKLKASDGLVIKNLAEVEGTISEIKVEGGKVTQLTYVNGKTCTYYNPVPDGVTTSDGKYNIK